MALFKKKKKSAAPKPPASGMVVPPGVHSLIPTHTVINNWAPNKLVVAQHPPILMVSPVFLTNSVSAMPWRGGSSSLFNGGWQHKSIPQVGYEGFMQSGHRSLCCRAPVKFGDIYTVEHGGQYNTYCGKCNLQALGVFYFEIPDEYTDMLPIMQ